MSTKEFELWDTYRQDLLGRYRSQSSALIGLYDVYRERGAATLEHLDIIYQRPNDKPIHLISGRDRELSVWLESLRKLGIQLRLRAGTDVIGLSEFLEFGGYDYVAEDRGGRGVQIDFERYAAVVSNDVGCGGGTGATEVEALARALVDLYTTGVVYAQSQHATL